MSILSNFFSKRLERLENFIFKKIAGLFLSASVYAFLCFSVIILYEILPTFQVKILGILVVVLLMAVFTKVRLKLQDVTEKEVDDLKQENERLSKSLSEEKMKVDNANDMRSKQFSKFLDLKNILRISFFEIELEHQQGFDFYIDPKTNEKKPFNSVKKDEYADKAKRIVGYYKIPYKVHLGIDLSKVKVYKGENSLKYSLPEIEINGVRAEKTSWAIKLEMEYDDSIIDSWDHWNLCPNDERHHKILEEVVEESRELLNKELPDSIKSLISKALLNQSEKTVSAIIKGYTGLNPTRIEAGELSEHTISQGTKIIEYIEKNQ